MTFVLLDAQLSFLRVQKMEVGLWRFDNHDIEQLKPQVLRFQYFQVFHHQLQKEFDLSLIQDSFYQVF